MVLVDIGLPLTLVCVLVLVTRALNRCKGGARGYAGERRLIGCMLVLPAGCPTQWYRWRGFELFDQGVASHSANITSLRQRFSESSSLRKGGQTYSAGDCPPQEYLDGIVTYLDIVESKPFPGFTMLCKGDGHVL